MNFSWRRLPEAFSKFFFSEVDAFAVGPLRIAFATLVLIQNLAVAPKLTYWFSQHGVLSLEAARSITDYYAWTLFSVLPKTDTTLYLMFAAFNAAAIFLLLGIRSRVMMPIVYLLMMTFAHRNRLILDGQDGMMRTIGFMLLFLPLDASFSLERRLRGGKAAPQKMSVWPLRVLQVETCLFFLGAGLWKLKGAEWVDGTSLYYVARLGNFFSHLPVPQFLFSWMPLVAVMTWGSMALELCAPILIWFKETRIPVLLALVSFHIGVHWCMNLLVFHFVMLLAWSSFLTGEEWRALAARLPWQKAAAVDKPRASLRKAS